jgi:hypothetical protein
MPPENHVGVLEAIGGIRDWRRTSDSKAFEGGGAFTGD